MNNFKVIYKNRLIEPETKFVDCSNKVIGLYELQYDNNHIVKVVKTGDIDIYQKIQTFANDCDFNRILKTIELTGNPSMYISNQTGDIDLTLVPSSLTDLNKLQNETLAAQSVIRNNEYFKYKGVPFDEFVKQFNTKDYYEFLKSKYENVKEVKKDE